MDLRQAIKATRNGAIAASTYAGITLIVVLLAISDPDGELVIFHEPKRYFDIFFCLACAIGMYRKSRVASVVCFIYFLGVKLLAVGMSEHQDSIPVAMIFTVFFGMAIQGSFTYHGLMNQKKLNN